ncbi:conserved hypothetical protein [Ricinus communis]|uniref:Uncharacterized protein n=1 Tax=Ricinus communis TaxID=3988 RepID=B9SCP0_RICCO|nr:conserved hypothetical protein [Ricinus communis]
MREKVRKRNRVGSPREKRKKKSCNVDNEDASANASGQRCIEYHKLEKQPPR